ncbi:IclR family transcriptional regulator [Actinocatenispora comari]|uniref:Glycerol operon regulatory protein n=1 Tax=Actinocatenispora comari TaxID=2807577 RepID=A0A8J4EKX9_9ACTN|nr:IclR family transcriptional regulator [Actinocatenispora comari]GIL28702.1 IclR family transcriptional regulator [Actinocatenispora comari]
MNSLPDPVKSARRALAILEVLTEHEQPMGFTELADRLGYPKSSLHGLLRTLVDSGWAGFDEQTRRYALGIRTLSAGNAYGRSLALGDRALPYMRKIRDELNETVQLAVLDGVHNVYVAKVDGRQALALASAVGRRLPAHTTALGKVLLAGLPDAELARRYAGVSMTAFTEHTITSLPALTEQLRQVRRRGHGTDTEEYTVGVRCLAVPVRDTTGHVVAGMSVSVPTIRFRRELRTRALELLREAGSALSAELGFVADQPRRTTP